MQKKWGYSYALFLTSLIAILIFFLLIYQNINQQRNIETANKILIQNELSQLVLSFQENPEDEYIINEINKTILKIGDSSGMRRNQFALLFAGIGILSIYVLVIFLWIYYKVIRPFRRLEHFSQEIAKGNFTSPLPVERTNIFGAFSWAFDAMRTELNFTRKEEKTARENNKILIATISHDIKTPISSIRAYAEALQHNMDSKEGRREKYLKVIIKKADEVADLTNDLFLHALSDMEKLEIKPELVDSRLFFQEILEPYKVQYSRKINVVGDVPDISIYIDPGRIAQVIDNVVMNAVKYAPESDIEIIFKKVTDGMQMTVQDFGDGISPEDMPFVCNKLYRGKNVGTKPGAGLGLYIAKDIMEKSRGNFSISNTENGLAVELFFPAQL